MITISNECLVVGFNFLIVYVGVYSTDPFEKPTCDLDEEKFVRDYMLHKISSRSSYQSNYSQQKLSTPQKTYMK